MMNIFSYLQYGFMQRAILGGALIGVLCGILGLFLVLRRFSLIGDGLAHITFGSVAVGLFFKLQGIWLTIAALPLVILGSLGIIKLTEKTRLQGDTAIGILSAAGIAGGVIIASLSRGFTVDLFSYLFGNILAISPAELSIAACLFAVVIITITVYYQELFSLSFDEELAKTSGLDTKKLNRLLAVLTAITVVLTMKLAGIMLVSALLILPPSAALQLAGSFRSAILLSAVFAIVSVIGGITLSVTLELPAGASIVVVNFLIFSLTFAFRKMR